MAKVLKILLAVIVLIVAVYTLVYNWRTILWGLAIGSVSTVLLRGGVLGALLAVMFVGTIVFIIVDILRDVL